MITSFRELDKKLEELNEEVLKLTNGLFSVMPSVPTALYPIIPQSLWNYWGMPKPFQRTQYRASLLQGRFGWFVCQSSHGTQQIKLYQPWKYKNEVNTPLRIRARRIMQLASQEPKEIRKEKVRELYRTMPYQLLKNEGIKLRMKNFYFDRTPLNGDKIKIYRAVDPGNIDPQTDPLYDEKPYKDKNTISFVYDSGDEEYFYAVNARNNQVSELLHFIWADEIEFKPKTVRKPDKWAEAAELINREAEISGKRIDSGDKIQLPPTAAEKRKNILRQRKFIFYKEMQRMQNKYRILKLAGYFGVRMNE